MDSTTPAARDPDVSGPSQRDARAAAAAGPPSSTLERSMSHITTADGTTIFYKDWGSGQPVVFSHGWPLTSDAWDPQLKLVADAGYRAIAHDRRGGGRSSQPWEGNDLTTYADDRAGWVDQLGLQAVVRVGPSPGGGEVTRYRGRHGTPGGAKAVLLGAIPPLMLRTDANPEGLPIS